MINAAIPSDCNIREKEHKKLQKYQGLKGNKVVESQGFSGSSGHSVL